jgi:Ser/Thr protein kinase RdoA (MazF antagonist)
MRLIHAEQYLLKIAIAAHSGDTERAHALEDELYHAVLVEIAKGESYAAELARAALRSRQLTFKRYCA